MSVNINKKYEKQSNSNKKNYQDELILEFPASKQKVQQVQKYTYTYEDQSQNHKSRQSRKIQESDGLVYDRLQINMMNKNPKNIFKNASKHEKIDKIRMKELSKERKLKQRYRIIDFNKNVDTSSFKAINRSKSIKYQQKDQKAFDKNRKTQKKSQIVSQTQRKDKWMKIISKFRTIDSSRDETSKCMTTQHLRINKKEKKLQSYEELKLQKFKQETNSLIKIKQTKRQNKKVKYQHKKSNSTVLISKNNYSFQTIEDSQEKKLNLQQNNTVQSQKPKVSEKNYLQHFFIRKSNLRRDYFVFGINNTPLSEWANKIEKYRDFLWKINFSNGLHVDTPQQVKKSYKMMIGYGNNMKLVKSIMSRRFWWDIIYLDDRLKNGKQSLISDNQWKNFNFVWTQLKADNYIQKQVENDPVNNQYFMGEFAEKTDIAIDQNHKKIFSHADQNLWFNYLKKNRRYEENISPQTYLKRRELVQIKKMKCIKISQRLRMHNHFSCSYHLGDKKNLYKNIYKHFSQIQRNVEQIVPLTFHISKGINDTQFQNFKSYFYVLQKSSHNLWIIKPGEDSNRGNGIQIYSNINDIKKKIIKNQKNLNGSNRTYIIQKYIQKPLLYQKRKFDIRHFVMITCINGQYKLYWYQEGYLRTSSAEYSLDSFFDPIIHLTNDAVQKQNENYGLHQSGNKISYQCFQRYIQRKFEYKERSFLNQTIPKMKNIAKQAVKSCFRLLDSRKRNHNFEIFGLDFMLDQQLNPFLIQFNTNPCLQTNCELLRKIIPELLQNTFKIALDPLFPPPEMWYCSKKPHFGQNVIEQNKYQLIADEWQLQSSDNCHTHISKNSSKSKN